MDDRPQRERVVQGPQPDYVDRYCAFVDILGFRQLIGVLKENERQSVALRDVLRKVHAPVNEPTVNWQIDFRAQCISDAVAISTLATDAGLVLLFQVIEKLAVDLLREGYFIRGALVKGKLYHDASMVFGEALVRAYELENAVVRYPRVMVTRDVMADVGKFDTGFLAYRRADLAPYVEQAEDGPHFVHVLTTVSETVHRAQIGNLNKRPEDQESLGEHQRMQDMSQRRLDEATDNPRHFEKVRWFALYWRKFVPFGVAAFLKGPGMD